MSIETAIPLLDSIPPIPGSVEIGLAVDNLSRLLHRRTGCYRNRCRDIAISAVFSALADAKVGNTVTHGTSID